MVNMSDEKHQRAAPAFQMYADDFLAGTIDLSAEEVGVYMRLLCIQWSKGVVSERSAKSTGGSPEAIDYVLSEKFERSEDGWRNRRLEEVRSTSLMRIEQGRRGGQTRVANAQAKSKLSSSQQPSQTQANVKLSAKPNASQCQANVQAKWNPPTPSPTPNINKEREQAPTLDSRSEEFRNVWGKWKYHLLDSGKPMSMIQEDEVLMKLSGAFPDSEAEQIAAVNFSIQVGAKNLILNGDHRQDSTKCGKPNFAGSKPSRRAAPTFEEFGL